MTVRDLLAFILRESGVVAGGQVPLAQDITDSLFRLNVMLGQWQRKRWMVYQLVDVVFASNGQSGYSVGPGQQFDIAIRPARIYSAFFRQYGGYGAPGTVEAPAPPVAQPAQTLQIVLRDSTSPGEPFYSNVKNLFLPSTVPVVQAADTLTIPDQPEPNAIDYPLRVLPSREDYSGVTLKALQSWPQSVWLETGYPYATAWFYPTPLSGLFELHLQLEVALQTFQNLGDLINLPPEYEAAIVYNMVVRTRAAYGMAADPVMVQMAKDGLASVRAANLQIPLMSMPRELTQSGRYNIYSDNADR